jgi:hypothetical protein
MKKQESLPESECELLGRLSGAALRARCAELRQLGWTLEAIGAAFTPPKSRSTIHAWTLSSLPPKAPKPQPPLPLSPPLPLKSIAAAEKSTPVSPPPPAPPAPAKKPARASGLPPRERRVFDDESPKIPENLQKQIAQLAPLARRYRARANPNGAYAMANDELTELCASLHRSGVSVRELSQAAGVTYRAMARRLGR